MKQKHFEFGQFRKRLSTLCTDRERDARGERERPIERERDGEDKGDGQHVDARGYVLSSTGLQPSETHQTQGKQPWSVQRSSPRLWGLDPGGTLTDRLLPWTV